MLNVYRRAAQANFKSGFAHNARGGPFPRKTIIIHEITIFLNLHTLLYQLEVNCLFLLSFFHSFISNLKRVSDSYVPTVDRPSPCFDEACTVHSAKALPAERITYAIKFMGSLLCLAD